MSDQKTMSKRDENRYKPIYTWDKERVSLVKKGEIDLKEEMKERAKGVSIYEMLGKYGSVENIPGYGVGCTTDRKDGALHGVDVDLTGAPQFSTDVYNMQLQAAEKKLAEQLKAAEEAKQAAAEAKAAAEAAAKAKEEFIAKKMAEEGGQK